MQRTPLTALTNHLVDSFQKEKRLLPVMGWFCISSGLFLILLALLFPPRTGVHFGAIIFFLGYIAMGVYIILKKDKIIANLEKWHQEKQPKLQAVDQFIGGKLDAGAQWADQHKQRAEQRRELLRDVKAKTGDKSLSVVAIGGNGWEFLTNKKLTAGLGAEGLYLWDMETLKSYTVPRETITDINVGGPGTVRSGGGAMGGGFGLEGFLVGAAAATVLNILTSHKTTKTLVHLKCENSEIFLLISTMEPDETRIFLSPLFVSLKPKSNAAKAVCGASGIAEEIEKLAKLLTEGHITSEEFANLKSRLL